MEIVRLGAVCKWDGDSKDGGQSSFSVQEFADFKDAERLTLHSGRGWTQGILRAGGSPPVSNWGHLTIESIIDGIYDVLCPEPFYDEPDDHDWNHLVNIFASHDMAFSSQELRQLPYVVEFGPKLEERLPLGKDFHVNWAEIHREAEARNSS